MNKVPFILVLSAAFLLCMHAVLGAVHNSELHGQQFQQQQSHGNPERYSSGGSSSYPHGGQQLGGAEYNQQPQAAHYNNQPQRGHHGGSQQFNGPSHGTHNHDHHHQGYQTHGY